MPVVLPHDFTTKTIVSGTEVQEEFNAVRSYTTSIPAADLAGGILLSQLEARYEHLLVSCWVNDFMLGAGGAGWPAAAAWGSLACIPLPGANGDVAWQVASGSWVCTDTGAGTAQFNIGWCYAAAGGGWVQDMAILNAAQTITNAAAANDNNDGTLTISAAAIAGLAFSANSPHCIRFYPVGAAEAGTLSAAGSVLGISLLLRRPISAS